MLALGLNRGKIGGLTVIPETFNPKSFPTAAVEKAKVANLPGRVFDAWGWGGYIMYAWPTREPARRSAQIQRPNHHLVYTYRGHGAGMAKGNGSLADQDCNRQLEVADGEGPRARAEVEYLVRDSTAVVFRRASDG